MKGLRLILVALAMLVMGRAMASVPADSTVVIRCISVEPDSSITLTWSLPIDTTGFNAYLIYRKATNVGNFILHDSIATSSTISYNDAVANAYSLFNSYTYYIKVRFVVGADTFYSIASDTVRPIMVQVLDIGVNGVGVARVTWNEMHTPPLTSSAGLYYIWRMDGYPNGTWVLIDSTTNLFYQQPAVFCNKRLGYRVEINDTVCKCTSVSSIGNALFYDFTPPAIVQIDSVSIDPITGNIIIGWARDSSQDTKGYTVVQRINHTYWTHIASIPGIDSTFYHSSFSSSAVDSFFILAVDSCNNQSSQGTIQNTIHVNKNIDTCDLSVVLTWNKYVGWKQGVGKYYILVQTGAGPYISVDSVGGNVTSYEYTHLNQFNTFNIRIRAVDSNGVFTSTSNVAFIDIVLHNFPHWGYIKTATVIADTKIRLDLYTDPTAQVYRYNIQRSTDTAAGFETIGWTGKYSNSQFSYIDSNVTATSQLYYYRFQVLDSCKIVVLNSNVVRPILLSAKANPDRSNTVSWTEYFGFDGRDSSYYLYRSIDGVVTPHPIAILPYGINTYRDTITKFLKSQGEFCYYVVQLEDTINHYGFKDSSRSNNGCSAQSPAIFIPNAFTPNGRNPMFIPVTVFANANLYDFCIYNRLGQLIFESTDPLIGWDGTYEGNLVPMGVYIYTITLIGQDDSQEKFIGPVSVLR